MPTSTTPSVGISGTQGQQAPNANGSLRGLDMTQFMKLLVTELQNQDPLSPMENSEILQQISQIREIEASQQEAESSKKLSETLQAMSLGQTVSNASGLIGKQIKAQLTVKTEGADGRETEHKVDVAGVVERASIIGGQPVFQVGLHRVAMSDIREIEAAK